MKFHRSNSKAQAKPFFGFCFGRKNHRNCDHLETDNYTMREIADAFGFHYVLSVGFFKKAEK
ncbi:hypothetical protein C7H79_09440 [Nitrosomonas supralitoralis]|uniref:Uncharacterized protein n=1 Tax=Nitrosomonas supralitoralis TaxID=2116706 RepID=A0A2P7NUR0_9PROT|nr:hypothetical protein C7H79_09440 [Nitrosomonas supralitoralis]